MQLRDALYGETAEQQIEREVGIGTIKTWSGVYLDPLRPTEQSVRIDDIAHALSLICRYGGHCNTHYSVAQHCLAVSAYVGHLGGSPACQMLGLLHDAEEAYFGDMPSPLKKHYPDFKKHGTAMREFIYSKYVPGWEKFPRWYEELVHKADQDMYQIERISFTLPLAEAQALIEQKYKWGAIQYAATCTEMEAKFLRRFRDLGAEGRLQVEGGGPVSPKFDWERDRVQV